MYEYISMYEVFSCVAELLPPDWLEICADSPRGAETERLAASASFLLQPAKP